MPVSARLRRGFTLFEVLGVVLITTLLLGVALNFYVDLSRQAARATEHTREVRRATAILDRVAADLEHALLVRKPAELDPLAHPWIFLAESSTLSVDGADRIKFVRRVTPRSSVEPAPSLGTIAYVVVPSEDGESLALRRWTRPGLPDGLDREFPLEGDPEALLVTDGIAHFAARFLDDAGEWRPSWDSSLLVESSELPWAVELEVELVDPNGDDGERDALDEPRRFVRQVPLPMRPIDLEALLEPDEEEEEGLADADEADLEGLTLADCVDFAQISAADTEAIGLSASDLQALQAQAPSTPFAPYAGLLAGHPAVRAQCR